jgi:hypothetical protein
VPSVEEAGVLGKRILGDYPQIQRQRPMIQEPTINASIPKPINDNIAISPTIPSKLNASKEVIPNQKKSLVPEVAYHGSNKGKEFSEFDVNKLSPDGELGKGVYLSHTKDRALEFANGSNADVKNLLYLVEENMIAGAV